MNRSCVAAARTRTWSKASSRIRRKSLNRAAKCVACAASKPTRSNGVRGVAATAVRTARSECPGHSPTSNLALGLDGFGPDLRGLGLGLRELGLRGLGLGLRGLGLGLRGLGLGLRGLGLGLREFAFLRFGFG